MQNVVYSRILWKTCEFEAYVTTRRDCCSLVLFELAQARMSSPLGIEEVSKMTVCGRNAQNQFKSYSVVSGSRRFHYLFVKFQLCREL